MVAQTPPHSIPKKYIALARQFSTFLIYKEQFIKLISKYQDIFFVFRSHPYLGSMLDADFLDNYINEVSQQHKKFLYYPDRAYIDIFNISDALITDVSSTLFDYLPTFKPISLCNSHTGEVAEELHQIVNSLYQINSFDDLEKLFDKVVINKQDYMQNDRKKSFKVNFPNNKNNILSEIR